jgi:Icc-related predicted phosphoesterase
VNFLSRSRPKRETRLFFATDVHGSERCFLKFINAARVYEADILVLGGDIAGKRVVPIVAMGNGRHRGTLAGQEMILESADDLSRFERAAADGGLYSYATTPEEVSVLESDAQAVESLFRRLAHQRLEKWLAIAEDRLKASGTRLYVNCGNDDPFELDQLISGSGFAIFPEGRLLDLDERRSMASCGFANLTPWRCERDVTEEELATRIDQALSEWTANGRQLLLNLHCPPHASGLDTCQLLKEDFAPVTEGGQPVIGPAGSTAVRAAIERYRPVLSLHGHIHESRGVTKIGPTLAINPGSEYPDGVLRGALVDFDSRGVKSYLLTSG